MCRLVGNPIVLWCPKWNGFGQVVRMLSTNYLDIVSDTGDTSDIFTSNATPLGECRLQIGDDTGQRLQMRGLNHDQEGAEHGQR